MNRRLDKFIFELKTPRYFAAFPEFFPGISHEEFDNGFIGFKRVVLLEVAQAQVVVLDYVARVLLLFVEDDSAKGRFARPIATDDTYLLSFGDGGVPF